MRPADTASRQAASSLMSPLRSERSPGPPVSSLLLSPPHRMALAQLTGRAGHKKPMHPPPNSGLGGWMAPETCPGSPLLGAPSPGLVLVSAAIAEELPAADSSGAYVEYVLAFHVRQAPVPGAEGVALHWKWRVGHRYSGFAKLDAALRDEEGMTGGGGGGAGEDDEDDRGAGGAPGATTAGEEGTGEQAVAARRKRRMAALSAASASTGGGGGIIAAVAAAAASGSSAATLLPSLPELPPRAGVWGFFTGTSAQFLTHRRAELETYVLEGIAPRLQAVLSAHSAVLSGGGVAAARAAVARVVAGSVVHPLESHVARFCRVPPLHGPACTPVLATVSRMVASFHLLHHAATGYGAHRAAVPLLPVTPVKKGAPAPGPNSAAAAVDGTLVSAAGGGGEEPPTTGWPITMHSSQGGIDSSVVVAALRSLASSVLREESSPPSAPTLSAPKSKSVVPLVGVSSLVVWADASGLVARVFTAVKAAVMSDPEGFAAVMAATEGILAFRTVLRRHLDSVAVVCAAGNALSALTHVHVSSHPDPQLTLPSYGGSSGGTSGGGNACVELAFRAGLIGVLSSALEVHWGSRRAVVDLCAALAGVTAGWMDDCAPTLTHGSPFASGDCAAFGPFIAAMRRHTLAVLPHEPELRGAAGREAVGGRAAAIAAAAATLFFLMPPHAEPASSSLLSGAPGERGGGEGGGPVAAASGHVASSATAASVGAGAPLFRSPSGPIPHAPHAHSTSNGGALPHGIGSPMLALARTLSYTGPAASAVGGGVLGGAAAGGMVSGSWGSSHSHASSSSAASASPPSPYSLAPHHGPLPPSALLAPVDIAAAGAAFLTAVLRHAAAAAAFREAGGVALLLAWLRIVVVGAVAVSSHGPGGQHKQQRGERALQNGRGGTRDHRGSNGTSTAISGDGEETAGTGTTATADGAPVVAASSLSAHPGPGAQSTLSLPPGPAPPAHNASLQRTRGTLVALMRDVCWALALLCAPPPAVGGAPGDPAPSEVSPRSGPSSGSPGRGGGPTPRSGVAAPGAPVTGVSIPGGGQGAGNNPFTGAPGSGASSTSTQRPPSDSAVDACIEALQGGIEALLARVSMADVGARGAGAAGAGSLGAATSSNFNMGNRGEVALITAALTAWASVLHGGSARGAAILAAAATGDAAVAPAAVAAAAASAGVLQRDGGPHSPALQLGRGRGGAAPMGAGVGPTAPSRAAITPGTSASHKAHPPVAAGQQQQAAGAGAGHPQHSKPLPGGQVTGRPLVASAVFYASLSSYGSVEATGMLCLSRHCAPPQASRAASVGAGGVILGGGGGGGLGAGASHSSSESGSDASVVAAAAQLLHTHLLRCEVVANAAAAAYGLAVYASPLPPPLPSAHAASAAVSHHYLDAVSAGALTFGPLGPGTPGPVPHSTALTLPVSGSRGAAAPGSPAAAATVPAPHPQHPRRRRRRLRQPSLVVASHDGPLGEEGDGDATVGIGAAALAAVDAATTAALGPDDPPSVDGGGLGVPDLGPHGGESAPPGAAASAGVQHPHSAPGGQTPLLLALELRPAARPHHLSDVDEEGEGATEEEEEDDDEAEETGVEGSGGLGLRGIDDDDDDEEDDVDDEEEEQQAAELAATRGADGGGSGGSNGSPLPPLPLSSSPAPPPSPATLLRCHPRRVVRRLIRAGLFPLALSGALAHGGDAAATEILTELLQDAVRLGGRAAQRALRVAALSVAKARRQLLQQQLAAGARGVGSMASGPGGRAGGLRGPQLPRPLLFFPTAATTAVAEGGPVPSPHPTFPTAPTGGGGALGGGAGAHPHPSLPPRLAAACAAFGGSDTGVGALLLRCCSPQAPGFTAATPTAAAAALGGALGGGAGGAVLRVSLRDATIAATLAATAAATSRLASPAPESGAPREATPAASVPSPRYSSGPASTAALAAVAASGRYSSGALLSPPPIDGESGHGAGGPVSDAVRSVQALLDEFSRLSSEAAAATAAATAAAAVRDAESSTRSSISRLSGIAAAAAAAMGSMLSSASRRSSSASQTHRPGSARSSVSSTGAGEGGAPGGGGAGSGSVSAATPVSPSASSPAAVLSVHAQRDRIAQRQAQLQRQQRELDAHVVTGGGAAPVGQYTLSGGELVELGAAGGGGGEGEEEGDDDGIASEGSPSPSLRPRSGSVREAMSPEWVERQRLQPPYGDEPGAWVSRERRAASGDSPRTLGGGGGGGGGSRTGSASTSPLQ